MATANETVKKVLDHLNSKINAVGGVVDSWSDGKGNWWRKYSDGCIEQGGVDTATATGERKVSFHKAFSSSNVCVLMTDNGEYGGASSVVWCQAWNVTNTSFTRNGYFSDNLGSRVSWYACGY